MPENLIDLRKYVCPVTFVMLKASLENINPEEPFTVLLAGRDTLVELSRSLRDDGFVISQVAEPEPGTFSLLIKPRPAAG